MKGFFKKDLSSLLWRAVGTSIILILMWMMPACVVGVFGECTNNGDCLNNEVCDIGGVCIFVVFCTANIDCGDGQFCGSGGFCSLSSPPPPIMTMEQ